MPTPYYDANDGYPAYLLLNDGRGQFTDVAASRGLQARRHRRTYSSSLVDLDDDHDLDLMVVSDFAGVDLYENDGRGRFTDVRDRWIDEWHSFGMAHTFGDYDLDGRQDFYVIGMSSTTARRLDSMGLGRSDFREHSRMRSAMGFGNRMYMRRDSGYAEPSFKQEVARTGWSWGTSSFDFDNDGDEDIYIANGHLSGKSSRDYCSTFWCHDLYTGSSKADPTVDKLLNFSLRPINDASISWNGYEKNFLLLNRSGRGFTNISFLMNVAMAQDCRGVVSEDLNGDGLMDLLVMEQRNSGRRQGPRQILHVFANQMEGTGRRNNWVGIRLQEQGNPGHAAGALVEMQAGARRRVKHLVTGDSYFSQHAPVVHFGLGKTSKVERIIVRWPGGKENVLQQPALNRYHTLSPSTSN